MIDRFKEALDAMPEVEWNEDNEEFEVVTEDAALWYVVHADAIKEALTLAQRSEAMQPCAPTNDIGMSGATGIKKTIYNTR